MTRPETRTDHNTEYAVWMDADNCKCVVPDDESSDEYTQWDDNHPWGEGVGGWEGRICSATIEDIYCEECSDDQGDWFKHMPICLDCEYTLEDDGTCQCEPEAAP
jgi:hypothetical protein